MQDSLDQEAALLAKRRDDGQPLSFLPTGPTAPRPQLAVVTAGSSAAAPVRGDLEHPCAFQRYHSERFSEVVPKILKIAHSQGHWTRNLAQYERVLRTFAWITGDKPLGDYDHTDVARYKNALMEMPRDYRPAKDFGRPFELVAQSFRMASNPRSVNTVKRDLAYMSTAHDILAEDEWAPRVPNTKALDFASVRFGKHKKVSHKTARPAWTVPHMQCLFSAPIWTGGGGPLHRLDANAGADVFHDAAYWLPLLLYYTHATLNEIAGLRADEVACDDHVPNLTIKDNDVRAEDGVDGGEKNASRGRVIPLHGELLRLGFLDYARAIRSAGHRELFPELYLNDVRMGGHQFRNIAWNHMVAWIALHMPVPINDASGKKADMHSIRALGSSFYAQINVPDLIRADLMGHARTGTNALHYSKRKETHGLDKVLTEYLAVMTQHVDVATSDLRPRPVNLLPVRQRSRLGRPRQ